MKFKTKEELIKNIKKILRGYGDKEARAYEGGYSDGIDHSFKSFAERVEFYKKYRYEPQTLWDDESELYEKICIKIMGRLTTPISWGKTDREFYRELLFDYCFSDVID